MPKPVYLKQRKFRRMVLLRLLDDEFAATHKRQQANAPRNGGIPVGGGDWMDSFFKVEAIEGVQEALREGKNLREARNQGRRRSQLAIRKWNQSREWQVHRNEDTAWNWLEMKLYRLCEKTIKNPRQN